MAEVPFERLDLDGKLNWLRNQSDELATMMGSNFKTLETHFKALEAEQKRLADAMEREKKRS